MDTQHWNIYSLFHKPITFHVGCKSRSRKDIYLHSRMVYILEASTFTSRMVYILEAEEKQMKAMGPCGVKTDEGMWLGKK